MPKDSLGSSAAADARRAANEPYRNAGVTLATMGRTSEIRTAADILNRMKNQEVADKALLDEFQALSNVRGGRRRRMRGGNPETEARAAFAAAKDAFAGFMAKTRALIGKLVGDNILTIAGTGIALNTGAGAAGLAIVKTAAGAGAPYVIGASVALMAAMAIYRMVRTIIIITAEEGGTLATEVAKTALLTDLQALDKAAADMIASSDPVEEAKKLFDTPRYQAAVNIARTRAAAAQLKSMVESGKTETARAARAAAREAAEKAKKAPPAAAAAAPPAAAAAPPAAAMNEEAPAPEPVAEAQAGQVVVSAVAAAAANINSDSKHTDGGRRLTSRRRRHRVSAPRRTRRSSSVRRQGGSRRRRE